MKSKEKIRAIFIAPMKALGVSQVPPGGAAQWHCEIKFDGYRAIAVFNRGNVELWSRNEKPLSYPEILPALEKLSCENAVLDGEIVALDEKGRSSFQKLQGRDLGERPPIVFYLFDLLFLDGRPLLSEPIERRRENLAKLLKNVPQPVLLSPSFQVEPDAFLKEAAKQGLEGIIVKRTGSVYEPDRRTGAWMKIKNVNEQEFVIGGFTPPRKSRQYFGAILVGHYKERKLLYAGKVGSGFSSKLLAMLHSQFAPLITADCPFENLPLSHRSRFGSGMTRAEMRKVTWLKPKLVAQIKFVEWTQDGLLRQGVFMGLREDKSAKAVVREAARKNRSR